MYQAKLTTSIGDLYVKATDKAIWDISFLDKVEAIKSNPIIEQFEQELNEYLNGKRKNFDVTFDFKHKGTEFQQKVWQTSLEIPYGTTITYQELAEKVGSPKAFRAVGGALSKNPVMILVPCHRILGKNGKLTGYAGPGEEGLLIKRRLIEIEKEKA
jgi:methylated-DNA-[protein]-cysteine S-methyltransferase